MVISMKICKVKDCSSKNHSHGYCNKHRLQVKRSGAIHANKIDHIVGEIWAKIPEHDNYAISNYGRVVNKRNMHLLVNQKRKTKKEYYEQVKLGAGVCVKIHTTIAKAFIHNKNNDTQVVFLDGDKTNIQLGNIQWKSLYRQKAFFELLRNDNSEIGLALSDYIAGNSTKLNSIISREYRSFKATSFFALSKASGYKTNFDRCLIDDSVNEGLCKGLAALKRGMLNDIANFIGWLSTIIRNTAKNIMYIERKFVSENQTNSNGDEFSLIDTGIVSLN